MIFTLNKNPFYAHWNFMIKQTFLANFVDLPLTPTMGTQGFRLFIKNAFYFSLCSLAVPALIPEIQQQSEKAI